ncbi:MAG: sigma-70 family RNA polymerase sigma factor [Spirochaetaceae bacterium]|jgi:RNA polymerase sigma-70 factor (ECF subfamily)|nr:sigma-70 family RNA polymerase sigma factor [Spirochaetaceae bacterium]
MNQNNGDWLDAVYVRFKDKIYGYFLKKLNYPEAAEDLCSQVFLEIAKNIGRFDKTKSSESTWIYSICRNLCNRRLRDFYKRRNIIMNSSSTLVHDEREVSYESLETERIIAADILADALSRLDTDKSRVIVLSYYHGLNPKEIADRLGLTYTNVCVLKSRALKELRKILNDEEIKPRL